MEIVVPQQWYEVLETLYQEKGIAVVLGATDTGKSTFAKFLVSHLCRRGLRVALVDADTGQSILGPPTTIGLAIFEPPLDRMTVASSEIFFVGSTTPQGNIPLHLKGVKRMVGKAISGGAEAIVVDTTGFVLGEAGKEFKRREIDLIVSGSILALEKSHELEPVLGMYQESSLYRIHRLPVSQGARSRPREERMAYREAKFKEYFHGGKERKLSTAAIRFEGRAVDAAGTSIPPEWALVIKGLLVGLGDSEGDTLALGLIISYDDEERMVQLFTPRQYPKKVKSIQLSSLRLDASNKEEKI